MRNAFGCLLMMFGCTLLAHAADDSGPAAVAQKLFDAMKAHDAAAATALFAPGATLASMDKEGKITVTPADKWAERIGASKSNLLERMWNPKVSEHGDIATLWADYDFHSDGKFSHCGIDTFTFLKTGSEWKIVGLSFTRETTGCTPAP